MKHHGFSHINLATNDLDATREFYEDVLGFPMVAGGTYKIAEGGRFRHAYFDTGGGTLISFLEPRDIDEVPDRFDTGINTVLNIPPVFYHIAFEAGDPQTLRKKRAALLEKGVPVTDVVDHDWAESVYFEDPVNGLTLEYSCYTRDLAGEDATLDVRFEIPFAAVKMMMKPQPLAERA